MANAPVDIKSIITEAANAAIRLANLKDVVPPALRSTIERAKEDGRREGEATATEAALVPIRAALGARIAPGADSAAIAAEITRRTATGRGRRAAAVAPAANVVVPAANVVVPAPAANVVAPAANIVAPAANVVVPAPAANARGGARHRRRTVHRRHQQKKQTRHVRFTRM
jgi:hypothetical protein